MAQLNLTTGRQIFVGFGRRTANTWKTKQLEAALAAGLATIATPENIAKLSGELQITVNQLLATTEPIVVVDDTAAPTAPAATPTAPAAKGKGKGKAPASPAAETAPVVAPVADPAVPAAAPAPAATTKAPKAPKEPKPAKEPKAPKEPKPAKAESVTKGVRYSVTRPYLCGQTLASQGMAYGATDAVLKAVDVACGEENPRETAFATRNGWHAIRGYMGWHDAATLCECNSVGADADGKLPTPAGVRYHVESVPRPYVAGEVLRAHGLLKGITPEMIAEVDKAYGEPNERETTFALRNAWHAIRGYFGINDEAGAKAQDDSMAAA